MATVVVINGRHRGEWYSVPESPRGMIFGRDNQILAEIIDPRVSQQHMRIARDPQTGRITAEDLDSRNGTRVNGKSITAQPLTDGDIIQIGHTLLGYTEVNLDLTEQVEGFIEQMRTKAGPTLAQIEDREQYTEAAALFSRLFRRPGRKRK